MCFTSFCLKYSLASHFKFEWRSQGVSTQITTSLEYYYHRLGSWGQRARRKLDQILHTQPAGSRVPLSTIQQCEYYVNFESEIVLQNNKSQ